ncbi:MULTISPECIES: arylmalonate decarboxylase [unclassified Roseovarius]|uniref:maleate cis-trans isomerase family protein n=1 Tax=unclassified Roseovarius TaxID=2614913 RepID=UPI00273F1069|nr:MULTISPECIES: arylmalonate decarboxylase [unclassified Roseovarius]
MNEAHNMSEAARQAVLDSVRMDEGRGGRARIGFVLIPNEQTIEEDMIRHLPPGVGAYFSRATMPREISTDSLAQLRGSLAETAARILPDDGLDVICFACTSGTVAVGEDASCAELSKGAPGARPTTLAGAVRKALTATGARRITLGSPYVAELNDNVAAYLEAAGFDVVAAHGMGLNYDTEMIRVAPEYLIDYARAIDTPEADTVLLSCGALRSIDVVDEIEQRLGKTVICSNQAMLWDCLRMAGIDDKLPGLGRLLREY